MALPAPSDASAAPSAAPPSATPTSSASPLAAHAEPTARARGRAGAWASLGATLVGRALRNPAVAIDLLRVAWRFRRRFWWRKPPFLPIPDATYVRWRMHTAYGDADTVPPAADLIRYARWVGRQR